MHKRGFLLAAGLVALVAGCAPTLPESGARADGTPVDTGAGVGFGSYEDYERSRAQRDRELRGEASAGSPVIPQAQGSGSGSGQAGPISSEELRGAGLPVGDAGAGSGAESGASGDFGGSQNASASGNVSVDVNNPGISDEQDFQAVSSRETIESDRERLEAQREAYKVIQPTAVPTRPGTRPNIVAYALSTKHDVGTKLYSRSRFGAESKFLRACASYASSDLAQEAFLAEGGPEKDRLGLDPDGDGFACYWDPKPFRRVRG